MGEHGDASAFVVPYTLQYAILATNDGKKQSLLSAMCSNATAAGYKEASWQQRGGTPHAEITASLYTSRTSEKSS